MKIVMTLMIRDEVDVIAAMLEHHRAQGVDHVLVTDNASVDGTTEVLERYEESGLVTLWHDAEHRKQQWSVVTKMARYAATDLGADWVINADADEFFVATDGIRTVRDVLAEVPSGIPYITASVVNLTGRPARDGAGFGRLMLRDVRTEEELHEAGIPFHPTADAVHRANPMVEVSQGNHFVSAPGWDDGKASVDLEVLHMPWRSWRQYERKVRAAGSAYESNPELSPSPRHHGMQDYRRLKGGRLESIYVAKHPTVEETAAMVRSGSLVIDERLRHFADAELLGARREVAYDDDSLLDLSRRGRQFAALEDENESRMLELRREQQRERDIWAAARERLEYLERLDAERLAQVADLEAQVAGLQRTLAETRSRRVVQIADRLRQLTRR